MVGCSVRPGAGWAVGVPAGEGLDGYAVGGREVMGA